MRLVPTSSANRSTLQWVLASSGCPIAVAPGSLMSTPLSPSQLWAAVVTLWLHVSMGSVGIRELRDHVSAVIRRAAAGEAIDVTDHGHPVARIVPLRAASVLDQLIAEGRATPAEGDLLDFEPPPRGGDEPLLSEVLSELRADER